jgi:hypothetical protein
MTFDLDNIQTDTLRIALQLLSAVAANTVATVDAQIQAQAPVAPTQPPADTTA